MSGFCKKPSSNRQLFLCAVLGDLVCIMKTTFVCLETSLASVSFSVVAKGGISCRSLGLELHSSLSFGTRSNLLKMRPSTHSSSNASIGL